MIDFIASILEIDKQYGPIWSCNRHLWVEMAFKCNTTRINVKNQL
jgi:hypothetical protein